MPATRALDCTAREARLYGPPLFLIKEKGRNQLPRRRIAWRARRALLPRQENLSLKTLFRLSMQGETPHRPNKWLYYSIRLILTYNNIGRIYNLIMLYTIR